jgi:hypothetical protein
MWRIHGRKVVVLTRGGLADGEVGVEKNPKTAVTTNCKKSAETIIPEKSGKGRTIVSLK